MDSAFFLANGNRPYIENGADEHPYGMPPPAERRSAPLFWGLVQGMFSGEPLPEPAHDGADWRIQAMRRREARIAELNNSVPYRPSLGEVVSEVVEAVREVVNPRKVTKTAAAVTWLSQVLRDGPRPQREIEEMARKEKIGTKPLKVAKKKLKVQSVRKGANFFSWRLPFAGKLPTNKDGQKA
jgi:hypothetical protein